MPFSMRSMASSSVGVFSKGNVTAAEALLVLLTLMSRSPAYPRNFPFVTPK